MPRRIEIELTSSKDDGTWTWRAAGARQPKGTLDGSILPSGAAVGQVLRVEADFFVDGIEITSVVPQKGGRSEPDRIELLGRTTDEPLVTSTLVRGDRGDRGDRRGPRREGGERRGRDGRSGPDARDGRRQGRDRQGAPRGDRDDQARPGAAPGSGDDRARRDPGGRGRRNERPRRDRPAPPPMPAVERPKAKRLRPGKVHRSAMLESLPAEQRPVAEQLVLGGLPAVRQAIEKQNAERAAAGEAPIDARPLLDLAEKLVRKVRDAEWRDRAEAAQRDVDQLDLRDLRSVVSAAEASARDAESRALADELRTALARRVEEEHAAWLAELAATLDVGRVVRALRVSSRPPKAGSPLPPELAGRLVEATNAALTSEAAADRWVAVLDALAFSPVRDRVIPASLPTGDLDADLRATIARLATRLPKIAHIFEIEADPTIPRPKPERRKPRAKATKAARSAKAAKSAKAATPATSEADAPAPDAPADATAPEPAADAPADATAPEPAPDAPADATAPEPAPDADAAEPRQDPTSSEPSP